MDDVWTANELENCPEILFILDEKFHLSLFKIVQAEKLNSSENASAIEVINLIVTQTIFITLRCTSKVARDSLS